MRKFVKNYISLDMRHQKIFFSFLRVFRPMRSIYPTLILFLFFSFFSLSWLYGKSITTNFYYKYTREISRHECCYTKCREFQREFQTEQQFNGLIFFEKLCAIFLLSDRVDQSYFLLIFKLCVWILENFIAK